MELNWKDLLSNETDSSFEKDGKLIERNDDRSIFKKDFDHICFWSSLRRLQDKAHVFPLEDGDFPRTRLTHSIEVMSIAEAFGEHIEQLIVKGEFKKIKTKIKKEYPNNPEMVTSILEEKYIFDEYHKWLDKDLYKKIQSIPTILRSASLIHDLGNPPYGHISEKTISRWFNENLHKFRFNRKTFKLEKPVLNVNEPLEKDTVSLSDFLGPELCNDFLHFDGNAELLRIVRKLQNISPGRVDHPVSLSYPLLATTIKYPKGFLQLRYPDSPEKHNKKNIFNSEIKYYDEIQEKLRLSNQRHPLAFLLEAADDIAYLVSDLEDATFKGLIKSTEIRDAIKYAKEIDYMENMKLINTNQIEIYKEALNKNPEISKLVDVIETYIKIESEHVAIKKICARLRGYFISRVKIEIEKQYDNIMKGKYYSDLLETSSAGFLVIIIKNILEKKVYYSSEIIKKKIEGINSINRMLDEFIPAVVNSYRNKPEDNVDFINSRLISQNFTELCHARIAKLSDDKVKVYELIFLVVDYISGMTDSFAYGIYQVIS